MNQTQPAPPSAYVSPDVLEDTLYELLDYGVDYWDHLLEDFFPNMKMHLMRKEKSVGLRLQSFMNRTVASDLPYLVEVDDWLRKYRLGVYQPLASPYWTALSASEPFFEAERREFKTLWNREVLGKA